MSTDTRNLTLTEKADAAFRQAAMKVIERARQTGTPVIIWENCRVTEHSAEELMTKLKPEMKRDEVQSG
jgi:hypothetical protein